MLYPFVYKDLSKARRFGKRFLDFNYDRQLEWFVETFRVAIRETTFVRRTFPYLLSVVDPEDFLDIPIEFSYPEEPAFSAYSDKVFVSVRVGGRLGRGQRRVFYAKTRRSLFNTFAALFMIEEIARASRSFPSRDRALIVVEDAEFGNFLSKLAKIFYRKYDISTEAKLYDFLKNKKRSWGIFIVSVNMLVGLIKEHPNLLLRRLKDRITFVVWGATNIPENTFRDIRKLLDYEGKEFRIIHVFFSPEAFIMGYGIYFDDENPYATPQPEFRPTYLSTLTLVRKLFDVSTFVESEEAVYPDTFIHRLKAKSAFVISNLANAFAIPNYFVGSIVQPERMYIRPLGTILVRVSDFPIANSEAITGVVLNVGGITIPQSLASLIGKALGTDRFIVVFRRKPLQVLAEILVDEEEKINSSPLKILHDFLIDDSTYKYLLPDIMLNYLEFRVVRLKGVNDAIEKLKPLWNTYKMYVVEDND